MVSRAFVSSENLRNVNRELQGVRQTITGSILPVLGLSAAFSIMGGRAERRHGIGASC